MLDWHGKSFCQVGDGVERRIMRGYWVPGSNFPDLRIEKLKRTFRGDWSEILWTCFQIGREEESRTHFKSVRQFTDGIETCGDVCLFDQARGR